MRFLVNLLHPAILFLVFSFIFVGFAILIYWIARKWPISKKSRSHEVDRIIQSIFSLLLIFILFLLWDNRSQAQRIVIDEANKLDVIWQSSQLFENPTKKDLQEAIKQYAYAVVRYEWESMQEGETHERTIQAINKMYKVLRNYQPSTANSQIFYAESVKALNELMEDRNHRLGKLVRSIPDAWYINLYIGFFLLLLFNAFKMRRHNLDLTTHIMLAFFFTFFAVAIIVLAYPFSGEVAISNEPFKKALFWQEEPRSIPPSSWAE